jgi:hypothetical protein
MIRTTIRMTKQEFRTIYPLVLGWIQRTLEHHAPATRPVASLGFNRLPLCYDKETLATSKVIPVTRAPVPPLSAMGLARFVEFEQTDMAGITYLDTYFVRADHLYDESLHFHELVHVIQWRWLGPEKFLEQYADGLERFGYRNSPLEQIAYNFQDKFERDAQPFNVEAACRALLK